MKDLKKQGIYQIKNINNGKLYVGQVCENKGVQKRFSEHQSLLQRGVHFNRHLQNSWNKHGVAGFEFSLIEEVEESELLSEREQHWIDKTWDYNYNICPTAGYSCKGRKHTEEAKRKIGEANSRRVWSAESKAKHSESQKNKPPVSDETRLKMSASQKGKTHTNETKAKIGDASRGRIVSEEAKDRIRIAQTGRVKTCEEIEKHKQSMRLKCGVNRFKGVRKKNNKWQARLTFNGKEIHLGYFNAPEEAAKNYDYYAKLKFGNNCFINLPNFDYSKFAPKLDIMR